MNTMLDPEYPKVLAKRDLIKKVLLAAATKVGPMNNGKCAGAALRLQEFANDKEFINELV